MTTKTVSDILASFLKPKDEPFAAPKAKDWEDFERKFQSIPPADFVVFTDCITAFTFPGDLLNVTRELPSNGNDLISIVYAQEMETGYWHPNMIPFYAIGNGDYFCLNAKEGRDSKVYYYYHERQQFEVYSEYFEEWLKALPSFFQSPDAN